MLSTMAQDRYFEFTHKVKIERLKEKLLNSPPPKRRQKARVLTTRRPPCHKEGKNHEVIGEVSHL